MPLPVHRRLFSACALLTLLACGGDEGGGSAPAPGVSAAGWQNAFGDKGGQCAQGAEQLAALPHVTVGSTTLFVGFEQTSGNNQDPFIARFDGANRVYCTYHEDDGPDGHALGITWNGGDYAYVVYTVVGGGSDLEGKGGWLGSYAPGGISGGGPKVSYPGRVRVSDGALESGSFVIAVTSARKVNSHMPKAAATVLEDGTIEFRGGSAHEPIDADGKSAMACTDYPFETRYRFSPDLKTLVCADSTNCTAQKACP
ncbi:MAG TPA: hypothetical protein VEY30_08655 [Myxococcaceae bacterium]|nr:hypothetical protein [Myxococcaceae bacterium]